MNKKSYLKLILFTLAVTFFVGCDDDYNVLGTDIVGIDNFGFGESVVYDAKTTNLNLGAVESSDLALNPFGIYNNPVFGEMTANYVTQVQLNVPNPTIDLALDPVITSVIMRIPYFSTKLSTASNGDGTYRLDSIYGPKPYSTMKLQVFESGYFMRDIDPTDQLAQAYYTDQTADFESQILGNKLNNDASVSQNNEFVFSGDQTIVTSYNASTGVATETKAAPAIKLNLDKEYFKQKIFNAPAGKLLNNNIFKDYFRGIYFKIEKNGANAGNLAMLNFKGGIITINYHEKTSATNSTLIYKSIILNMTGKTASLVQQAAPNVAPGDGKLLLKGGANNYMATIDLNKAQIDQIRDNNWLVNDASLTFTIDNATMNAGSPQAAQPLRLYLYDINNKRQIADYTTDGTLGSNTTKYNKSVFGGIIKREPLLVGQLDKDRRGLSYKIRITNHIRAMVLNDTVTNVKLGLVVTEDINVLGTKKIKTPLTVPTPDGTGTIPLKVVPTMSAVHPLGTILYGSDAADVTKRPKFQIYYTTPTPKQN